MENQTPNQPPKRKQMAPRDMILIALAVLVMMRVDWGNMNSFHYLILFMLFLCFMLRWSNMRKDAIRKQNMERYKDLYEAEAAKKAAAQSTAHPASEEAAAAPAEEISANTAEVVSDSSEPSVEEKTEI